MSKKYKARRRPAVKVIVIVLVIALALGAAGFGLYAGITALTGDTQATAEQAEKLATRLGDLEKAMQDALDSADEATAASIADLMTQFEALSEQLDEILSAGTANAADIEELSGKIAGIEEQLNAILAASDMANLIAELRAQLAAMDGVVKKKSISAAIGTIRRTLNQLSNAA